jgi:hypothetical protein
MILLKSCSLGGPLFRCFSNSLVGFTTFLYNYPPPVRVERTISVLGTAVFHYTMGAHSMSIGIPQ